MIGLGAKYLKAAGFGRYRITAASLGSAKVIWPELLTAATKRAIMAAFGVDGTAVIAATNEYLKGIAASDKAKATALAGFINEDPMMVCSLGLEPQGVTMPVRYLKKSVNSDYFDLGIILKGASTGVRVGYKLTDLNLGSNVSIFGARAGYGQRDFSINFGAWGFGTFYIGYNSSHGEPSVPRDNAHHIVKINKGKVEVDSWSKDYGVSNFETPGTAWLFANRNGDNHPVTPACQISECYMTENDVESHWFLPYKKPSGDSYTVELLDVWTGNLATKYGSFTIPDISYTPTQ